MQSRASLASWYALLVLSVTTLYSVIDRQVIILLSQALKADLNLSDTQIGSLQGLGAVLFASIAAFPLGWLADRMDRRLLLALCTLVWSVGIATCGLSAGYGSLLASVALLGAGEAGLSTIVFALIPEIFPERQRITANFIYYAASVIGGGVGVALAGAVVDHIGIVSALVPTGLFTRETWRLVFFIVAVPGPFLALAVALIRLNYRVPPVPKNTASAIVPSAHSFRRYLAENWKAITAVFLPFSLVILGASAIFTWMPVILMRKFGMTPGAVGAGLGTAIVMGSVVGLLVAGVAAKVMKSRWGLMTPVRLSQIGYGLYALITPLYFFARTPTETFIIASIQMGIGIGGNSLLPTVVQDLAPTELLGRFFAISTVASTLFGVISPVLVGLLSDHVYNPSNGLLMASLTVAFPSVLIGAVIYWLADKHIKATVEQVHALSTAS
jgi:MFS family permease